MTVACGTSPKLHHTSSSYYSCSGPGQGQIGGLENMAPSWVGLGWVNDLCMIPAMFSYAPDSVKTCHELLEG